MAFGLLLAAVHADVAAQSSADVAADFKAEAYASRLAELRRMTDGNLEGIPQKCIDKPWWWDQGTDCWNAIGRNLVPLDPARREAFGERYDPKKWTECEIAHRRYPNGPGHPYYNVRCEPFILRRPENPEDWPDPKVPPKWPEAPKESVYRPGMDAGTYFKALCDAEAGEFIYRTVEDVEGFYIARPREGDSDDVISDKYVVEDPWGIYKLGAGLDAIIGFMGTQANPRREVYRRFVEYPFPRGGNGKLRFGTVDHESMYAVMPEGMRYSRYSDYDGSNRATVRKEFTTSLKSRYAISWRGIHRPNDRDIEKDVAIAGGEMGIFDLQTGELLALRRQFMAARRNSLGKFSWLNASACSQFFDSRGRLVKGGTTHLFNRVLKTIAPRKTMTGD